MSKQLSQNPIYVSILCMHSVHNNKALDFLFNLNPTHTHFFCHPISLILLIVLALSFHLPLEENRYWTIKYMVLGFYGALCSIFSHLWITMNATRTINTASTISIQHFPSLCKAHLISKLIFSSSPSALVHFCHQDTQHTYFILINFTIILWKVVKNQNV